MPTASNTNTYLLSMWHALSLIQQGGEAQEDAREWPDLIDEIQVTRLQKKR